MWIVRLLAILCCIAGPVLSQTFQYSRGWTNGKRAALNPQEAACHLSRLRIILEGRNIHQLYWPCEWFPYETGSNPHGRTSPEAVAPLASDIEER